jgi:hypothetical protein
MNLRLQLSFYLIPTRHVRKKILKMLTSSVQINIIIIHYHHPQSYPYPLDNNH